MSEQEDLLSMINDMFCLAVPEGLKKTAYKHQYTKGSADNVDNGALYFFSSKQFAEKTYSKCVNIYVINANFSPVENYRDQLIINRTL